MKLTSKLYSAYRACASGSSMRRNCVVWILAAIVLFQPCVPLMAAPAVESKSKQKTAKPAASAGGAKSKQKATQPATPSSKDLKKQQQSAQAEIKKTKEDIRKNELEVKQSLNELSRLEDGIASSQKETQALSNEVGKLSGKISTLQSKIASEEKELSRLRTEYLKAVKKMRVSRKRNSGFAYLFSAKNMAEAERRMRYLKEFSEWKTRQTTAINARVEALKTSHKDLERAKSDKNVMLNREMAAQKKLNEQKARQDIVIAELKANGDVLQAHLAKKQEEVNLLKNQVAAVIAEEQRRLEEQRRAEAERKRKQEEAARAERERKERERQEHERAEQARLEKARQEREAAEQARLRAQEEAKQQQSAPKSETPKKATPKKEESKKTEPKKETPKKESPKNVEPKKEETKKEEITQKSKSDKSYAEARKRKPRSEAVEKEESKNTTPKKEESKKTTPKKETPKKESPKTDNHTSSGGDFASMRGALPRPVSGAWRITGKFGKNSLPDLPNVTYDNPGIDVEVSKGTAINAVYNGSVSGVYMVPGFGTVIIVNHGDYYTVYGNITSPAVKVGDSVRQGQRLGSAGENPDNPGHGSLHFEVWKGREKQNPTGWIK